MAYLRLLLRLLGVGFNINTIRHKTSVLALLNYAKSLLILNKTHEGDYLQIHYFLDSLADARETNRITLYEGRVPKELSLENADQETRLVYLVLLKLARFHTNSTTYTLLLKNELKRNRLYLYAPTTGASAELISLYKKIP